MEKTVLIRSERQRNISRLASLSNYRSINNRLERGAWLHVDHAVPLRELIDLKYGSYSSFWRAVQAIREKREIGKSGHPGRLTSDIKTIFRKYVEEELEKPSSPPLSKLQEKVFISQFVYFHSSKANELVLAQGTTDMPSKPLSDRWIYQWIDAQPDLERSKPKVLDRSKIVASCPEMFYNCIRYLVDLFDEIKIDERSLYNYDETSIRISAPKTQVVHMTGTAPAMVANPPRIINATLTCTICADGSSMESLLFWPLLTVPEEFSILPDYKIRPICHGKGWLDGKELVHAMTDFILPAIRSRMDRIGLVDQWAILVFDGHSTRLSLQVV